jgi:hypothetical protein
MELFWAKMNMGIELEIYFYLTGMDTCAKNGENRWDTGAARSDGRLTPVNQHHCVLFAVAGQMEDGNETTMAQHR